MRIDIASRAIVTQPFPDVYQRLVITCGTCERSEEFRSRSIPAGVELVPCGDSCPRKVGK